MARAGQHEERGIATRDGARGLLRAFRRDARGATAIEYGMIGFLVFAVAAGAIKLYGTQLNNVYNTIGTTISQAQ